MIHLVNFSTSPGGIEVMMQKIVNSIPEKKFKAFIIRPPSYGEINVYTGNKIDLEYGHKRNIQAMICLWKYSRRFKNDIFHAFNIGPFFLFILKLAGIKKLVYSIRGSIYWHTILEKIIRKPLWKMIITNKIIFIANSMYSKSVFINTFEAKKINIEVVYNPVASLNTKDKINELNSGKLFEIIYVGRLVNGKNLFRWLDIAVSIYHKNSNTRFTIYGEGILRSELEEYSIRIGISDKVRFMGYTSEIAAAYLNADLLLFLSEYESFGNVVVESILCGTPVIATAIPSMQEIFENYPQFLVPNDCSLNSTVLEKIESIETLKALLPEVKKEFNNRFSLEKHIEKLKEIYSLTS